MTVLFKDPIIRLALIFEREFLVKIIINPPPDLPFISHIPDFAKSVETLLRDQLALRNPTLPVDLLHHGHLTDFQKKVLFTLSKIPAGKVISYGTLAQRAGFPHAARAVGHTMAQNPFPVLIPCHRVIKSDRKIGYYGGGQLLKKQLLIHEGIRLDHKNRIKHKFILKY